MPYKENRALPENIQKILPVNGQTMFREVFNQKYSETKDESKSYRVAWGVVKKHFKKVDDKWTANSSDFTIPEIYTFELETPSTLFIMNSDDGTITMEAVLADTTKNTEGKYFATEDLLTLANQINKLGSTLPDVDHATLRKLFFQYNGNTELIMNALREQKGVFKSINALVSDGKLWIKAVLDKRYKNHVDKFKGLSIEAIGENHGDNRIRNPTYMGFTFTNSPKLIGAQIAH